jgi:TRAP-type C4-dicarboxylate transport system substrate-binding protein
MTTINRRNLLAAGAAGGLAAYAPGALAQGRTVNLKFGNAGNAQTISNQFNVKLWNEVAKRTNGQIKVEIFAGTLGGEQRLLEGMALGTIDVYNGAYTGTREFDIFYSPGFFRDGAHAKRVIQSPVGARASEVLEKRYQARLLGIGRLGPWVLSTKKKISSIEDIKGMKLRAPQIEGMVEALKFLGANPTPIAFNEIYLALQNGTVDGFVSALNPSVAGKFYEVSKYLVSNPFGEGLDKEAISTRAWRRLSDQQQRVVLQTFEELEATEYFQAGINAITTDIATWKRFNGDDSVVTFNQAELVARMAPLNKRLADEVYGAGSWDIIRAL